MTAKAKQGTFDSYSTLHYKYTQCALHSNGYAGYTHPKKVRNPHPPQTQTYTATLYPNYKKTQPQYSALSYFISDIRQKGRGCERKSKI